MDKLALRWLFSICTVAVYAGHASAQTKADPTGPPATPSDGTYRVQLCEGDCTTDPKAITGIIVIDASHAGFLNQTGAMQSFMRTTSGLDAPDYCYYFDPATSNNQGRMFDDDIVAFGAMKRASGGAPIFSFSLDSPDFRYYSEIEASGQDSFVGGWRSYLAINHGRAESFRSKLHAIKSAEPNTLICFDAVRKHERLDLRMQCWDHRDKTCEPGDRHRK